MEDEVLASAGVDSFEEIFKLIFAKLYDELICANDPTAYLQFRNNGNTDYELKEKFRVCLMTLKRNGKASSPTKAKSYFPLLISQSA